MTKTVYKLYKHIFHLINNIFFVLIFLISFILEVNADPSTAISFYNDGKFENAKDVCQKKLNQENPICLNLLGVIIITQNNSDKYEEALTYFEKAWSMGYSNAAKNLAWMYALGLGVEQDLIKSSSLYQIAVIDSHIEKDVIIDRNSNSGETLNKPSEDTDTLLELQLRSSYASYLKIKKVSEVIDSETNEKKIVQSSELNHIEDSIKFIIETSKKNGLDTENIINEVKKDQELTLMLITNDFGLMGIDFRMDVVTNLKLID